MIIVGVINIGKNFPAAYSFAKSEAAVSFSFIFNYVKHWVFGIKITECRVVLGD
jgi:hypothetical protein